MDVDVDVDVLVVLALDADLDMDVDMVVIFYVDVDISDVEGIHVDAAVDVDVNTDEIVDVDVDSFFPTKMDASDEHTLEKIKIAISHHNLVNLEQAIRKIKNVKSLNKIRRTFLSTVDQGKLDVVSILLTHGVNVNSRNSKRQTALIKASEHERLDIVKLLLEHKANVNLVDKNKKSALCYSVKMKNVEIVRLLVDNGADVNYRSFTTPLYESCKCGCFELVKILVEAGADVNKKDNSGDSPLCKSTCNGNLDIVKLLVKKCADVNEGLSPPLFYACDNGHVEITNYLIDAGADVNFINSDGESVLCRSATKGHFDIVKLLLERGAEVNNRINRTGETALLCAVGGDHSSIVELLLQYGADVNMVDGERNNALGIALNGENVIIAAILLQYESRTYTVNSCYVRSAYSSLNQTNKSGRNVLMLAAMKGFYSIVNDLQKQSDLSIFDVDGNTAFMLAAMNGHLDIVELLYDGTVDVNFKGQNALMLAAIGGHVTVVEWLISKGFDVNKTDHCGNTALMLADKPEVVEVLLKYGADVKVWKDGRNALMELLSKNYFTSPPYQHYISNNFVISQQTVMKRLLLLTNDLNAKDNNGETAILKVLKNSTYNNLTNIILDHHPDVNIVDNEGNSPLMLAVQNQRVEIITRILSCTHDVNHKNKQGKTALMFAVEKISLEHVKLLLATNLVDVNIVDNDGNSALMLAIKVENDKPSFFYNIHLPSAIIQELLHHDADVNHVNNNKTSVLMLAVQKRFIPAGIYRDIDMGDSEGKTALMYAVETCRNKDVVRQLLGHHKADVNVVDNTGETALIKAVKNSKEDNVKILLKHKADIYIVDKQGRTALMWAAKAKCDSRYMITLLLKTTRLDQITQQVSSHKSALDQTDIKGRTALMWATKCGDIRFMEYLLGRGVCVSQIDAAVKKILITVITRNRYGNGFKLTASGINFILKFASNYPNMSEHISIKSKNLEYFDLADKDSNTLLMLYAKHGPFNYGSCNTKLLEIKQDVNAVNKYKKTALMIALENRNYEFIEQVCKLFKEADVVCPKGRTLLMMAAQAGLVDTVKYLVSKGSKVNQVDKKQRTALMYALYFKPVFRWHYSKALELIEYLLFQDADVNVSDYKHETMLIKLLKHKVDAHLLPVIKQLLNKNAQTNVMDREDRSPLMLAIIQLGLKNQRQNKGSTDKNIQPIIKEPNQIVHLLLEKTDDVNTTDNKGNTALMLASKYGFNNVVQILLKKTNDINRVNKKGQTAYDLALKNGHYSVVQTLVDIKANANLNDILEFESVFSGLHKLHERSVCNNTATRDVELWTAFLNELAQQSALAINRGKNSSSHIYNSGLNTWTRHTPSNLVQDSNSRIFNFKDLLNKIYEV
ncbi:serine/threonine-protein phosphatase 6 regulatory ankyrin repeat subunit B-like [Physella acuta]|uniref:serine/threonine-protein phosphatase 6 regulatory ankyrin repeat subunit B-like n=1 Tax=Physella acuta TaxID=109671 RepID=UPI0027DD992E|nr:serine/threonine-protein phosphatase 6 regulatory ankyrin repeat subunit B-like [Physella acuta]